MKGFNIHMLFRQLLVLVSYFSLYVAGWLYSVNLETVTSAVSWFLPAGIRVAFLLYLPKKYWPAIVLAEIAGTRYIFLNEQHVAFENLLQSAFHVGSLVSAYMLCIALYLKQHTTFELQRVAHLVGLFGWLVIFLPIFTFIHIANNPAVIDSDIIMQLEFSIAILLGDLVGIITILVPVAFIRLLLNSQIPYQKIYQASLATAAVMAIFFSAYLINIELIVHVRIIILILFIIIVYYFHTIGAALSVIALNIAYILGQIVDVNLGEPIDNQLFLLATSLTTLLLGAAGSQQQYILKKLQTNNEELNQANAEQVSLSDRLRLNNRAISAQNKQLFAAIRVNQELSTRLVNIQETERNKIAQDLHDHIGQNITAIKIDLSVAKASTKEPELITLLNNSQEIADKIYLSTSDLINTLHPRELDDMGLESILAEGGPLYHVLHKANISYKSNISGDLSSLANRYNLAIYRITQEVINNTLKHSKANKCELTIAKTEHLINLTIVDDGVGFDTDIAANGFGLMNIHDRVSALGGNYKISADSHGTRHEISFILTAKD